MNLPVFIAIALHLLYVCFFFNHTATTEIYTLSLHDALPILPATTVEDSHAAVALGGWTLDACERARDRQSTRLNSSHTVRSYAVFCLKKKHHVELVPNLVVSTYGQLTGIFFQHRR